MLCEKQLKRSVRIKVVRTKDVTNITRKKVFGTNVLEHVVSINVTRTKM